MNCIICNSALIKSKFIDATYVCPVNDQIFELKDHNLVVWGEYLKNFSITLNSEKYLKNIDPNDMEFFVFNTDRVLWNNQRKQIFEFKQKIFYKDAFDFISRVLKLRYFL